MSVFKRPGASVYSYDFRHRNHRFSGSTGCTSKREAQLFEAREKERLKAQTSNASELRDMTFDVATTLYWEQVGTHHRNSVDTERSIDWLIQEVGAKTLVTAISNATLAQLVARRRAMGVSLATVNRSVGEIMRGLLRRADGIWGVPVQRIDWKKHILKEPQERVREASETEEKLILDSIKRDYAPALRFAILTGCRRAEIVSLVWTRVSFTAREFRVIGKGDKARTIPMTQAVFDLLWSLKDDGCETVFTFIATRTRRIGDREWIRGERYPITDEGFKSAWRRGPKALASLSDFRFHDTRHTAATRLVRATGNLRLAQSLLGHTDIATTTRYAHVTHEDLRRGLEASHAVAPATETATEEAAPADNVLKMERKTT